MKKVYTRKAGIEAVRRVFPRAVFTAAQLDPATTSTQLIALFPPGLRLELELDGERASAMLSPGRVTWFTRELIGVQARIDGTGVYSLHEVLLQLHVHLGNLTTQLLLGPLSSPLVAPKVVTIDCEYRQEVAS